MVELDNPFAQCNRARNIVRRLELQPGMKVLDVGCGPGRVTIPLAQQIGSQGEVWAIDIQPGMLRRAKAKAQAANLNNIRFLQIGAGEGKLERCQYDRAVLVTVLGEIPDQESALREIAGALKPGWDPLGDRGDLRSSFSGTRHRASVSAHCGVAPEGVFWESTCVHAESGEA